MPDQPLAPLGKADNANPWSAPQPPQGNGCMVAFCANGADRAEAGRNPPPYWYNYYVLLSQGAQRSAPPVPTAPGQAPARWCGGTDSVTGQTRVSDLGQDPGEACNAVVAGQMAARQISQCAVEPQLAGALCIEEIYAGGSWSISFPVKVDSLGCYLDMAQLVLWRSNVQSSLYPTKEACEHNLQFVAGTAAAAASILSRAIVDPYAQPAAAH